MEFVGGARPFQAGDTGVLLPTDLFLLQQRPASPTIADARASDSSVIDTSSEKSPQVDEKASRRFICCKRSVCLCEVVCVRACEAYRVPSMELCSVGDTFSINLCLRVGPTTAQAPLSAPSPACCQSCIKGIDCFRPPGYGELPEMPFYLIFVSVLVVSPAMQGLTYKAGKKKKKIHPVAPLLKTLDL